MFRCGGQRCAAAGSCCFAVLASGTSGSSPPASFCNRKLAMDRLEQLLSEKGRSAQQFGCDEARNQAGKTKEKGSSEVGEAEMAAVRLVEESGDDHLHACSIPSSPSHQVFRTHGEEEKMATEVYRGVATVGGRLVHGS